MRKTIRRSLVLLTSLVAFSCTAFVVTPAASARDHVRLRIAHRGAEARWNLPVSRFKRSTGIRPSIAERAARPAAAADFGFPGEAPTVQVGDNPVGDVVDPATHTVYVANGNDNTVSVINDSACNAQTVVGCDQTPPTVAAGQGPLGMALDQATHTLYVSDSGASTVTMIDTDACSALHPAGCVQTPPTVSVGTGYSLLAFDRATDTVYVPNGNGNTVSMIDAATCNVIVQSGCTDLATTTVGFGPTAVAVDDQTHTAYVANYNDGTLSLIDTATCNGTLRSGCDGSYPTVSVGSEPSAVVVDQPSNTVYAQVGPVGDGSLGSVAMVNGQTCNVTTTWSCGLTPRSTPDGSGPIWMIENTETRTVYAVNQGDSDISVIDAATCNATVGSGCRKLPPALSIGGPSSLIDSLNGAGSVAVDQSTDTLYATSQAENNVSVLNGATCDATDNKGCTRFAPTTTVGNGAQGDADDPATHTVYVTNGNDDTVSVINTAECNAAELAGCDRTWPTVKVGFYAQDIRVDVATDTVYVVNGNDNTVSVINGATCNAFTSAGCNQTAATVDVGNGPFALGVDQLTDTIYVANSGDGTVSVIDGATCNGTYEAGCDQTPPTVTVGSIPVGVAVDQATNTVYISNGGSDSVSMIDGASCDSAHRDGCDQTPGTVALGNSPYPIAVDQATGTVYVVANNYDNGNTTLSLINGKTCNAADDGGCSQLITVPAEPWLFGIAVDETTGTVYLTSVADSDVSAIDGRACAATAGADCRIHPIALRMGGLPGSIALDPSSNTAYMPDNEDGEVSFFGLGRAHAASETHTRARRDTRRATRPGRVGG